MDGTPIYDIKPYLPYVDSHADARGGFTDDKQWQQLQVELPGNLPASWSESDIQSLKSVLSLDPRPHYHADPQREYVMPFRDYEVHFIVSDTVLRVLSIA